METNCSIQKYFLWGKEQVKFAYVGKGAEAKIFAC